MTLPTSRRPSRTEPRRTRSQRRRAELELRRSGRFWWGCLLLLAAAVAVRFVGLENHPATDYDEWNYRTIGRNVAEHGQLMAKTPFSQSPEHYFYNPPFYFGLLGGWFRLFGDGVYQARLLAAGASVLTLLMLAVLLRRLICNYALLAVLLLALDGWMVFTNRVGWMENVGFVFAVGSLMLYERALREPTMLRFVVAGLALVWATIFKHQFAYFVVTVAICWLLVRRCHRQHLVLFLTTIVAGALYVAAMLLWDAEDYRREMGGQILRLMGKKASSGTVNSPGQLIAALQNQYAIYFGMVVGLAVAGCVVVSRMIQVVVRFIVTWRGRTPPGISARWAHPQQRWNYVFERVSGHPLLFAWAAAAILCFGATMKVRLPHYTFLVLVPLYCYLAAEIRGYLERANRQRGRRIAVAALVLVITGSGLFATYHRMALDDRNAFAQTAQWINQNVPQGSLIITEEPVGNNTPDGVEWDKIIYVARYKTYGADYLVVYETLTFKPRGNPALDEMVREGQLLVTFRDFKAVIRIYRITYPP